MTKTLSPITPGNILLEEFLKPMKIARSKIGKKIEKEVKVYA